MDEQTRKLLEECTSGCKMAVSSIQQILEFTQDSTLQKVLNKDLEQHTNLQHEAEKLLSADGFDLCCEPGKCRSKHPRIFWLKTVC